MDLAAIESALFRIGCHCQVLVLKVLDLPMPKSGSELFKRMVERATEHATKLISSIRCRIEDSSEIVLKNMLSVEDMVAERALPQLRADLEVYCKDLGLQEESELIRDDEDLAELSVRFAVSLVVRVERRHVYAAHEITGVSFIVTRGQPVYIEGKSRWDTISEHKYYLDGSDILPGALLLFSEVTLQKALDDPVHGETLHLALHIPHGSRRPRICGNLRIECPRPVEAFETSLVDGYNEMYQPTEKVSEEPGP